MRLRSLLFIALLLSGCSTTINLYPIKGPLAEKKPIPEILATADGITGNTGNLTLVMPDNEIMKGKWSSLAPQQVSVSSMSLFNTYGASIYGSVITQGNVPGVNKGQAFLHGDKGTTMEVEFLTGSGTANGYGVAKDSNGNIYKVLF